MVLTEWLASPHSCSILLIAIQDASGRLKAAIDLHAHAFFLCLHKTRPMMPPELLVGCQSFLMLTQLVVCICDLLYTGHI
jgi:hypothetical protein